MRVFVAGATGVLGRRIVRQLAARGHEVVALVRSDEGERTVRSLGANPRRADLFDVDALTKAAVGCDVVIRAATAIPTKLRPRPRDWALNDRIRRDGTRTLAAVTARVGAAAFIEESIVWAVRGPDGRPFDEDAPPVNDPVLASALESERIAREAATAHGFKAAVLRCGSSYSADSWHVRLLGESLYRGRPALIGGADPIWSLIHAEDAASAFTAAAEKPQNGVWHVVDDRPVAMSEFLGTLAKKLGARPPRRLPRWVARIVLGSYMVRLLSTPFQTTSARFRRDFGWRPSYPTCGEGLDEIVSTWRTEGFPTRKG